MCLVWRVLWCALGGDIPYVFLTLPLSLSLSVQISLSVHVYLSIYLSLGLAMNGDSSHLTPILEKMPWDAVNVGNHELYKTSVLQQILQPGGFVEWWGDKYVSSNIVIRPSLDPAVEEQEMTVSEDDVPMGNRYRILQGRQSRVLLFGFLYDMTNNANVVQVLKVEQVVQQPWFATALQTETYDAIVVLAHMDVRDSLVTVILNQIRALRPTDSSLPVLFVTGHTHHRDVAALDETSFSFEAGRFLDTIGFISIPTRATVAAYVADHADVREGVTVSNVNVTARLFQYKFLNANVDELKATLGMGPSDVFDTEDGIALSKFINRTQTEMGLRATVGCMDISYYMNRSLFAEDSLWRLFVDNVVRSQFEDTAVLFIGQGQWRYDLIAGGNVTLDDVIAVAPFNETLYVIDNVPLEAVIALNRTLNNVTEEWTLPVLPNYIMASPQPIVDPNATQPVPPTSGLPSNGSLTNGSTVNNAGSGNPFGRRMADTFNGTTGMESASSLRNGSGSVTGTSSSSSITAHGGTTNSTTTIISTLPPNPSTPKQPLYTVITTQFEIENIQGKLAAAFPEAKNVTPVPLNLTTTSIWLNYIQNINPGCQSNLPKDNTALNGTSPGNAHSSGPTFHGPTVDQADALRIGFSLAAVVVVIGLVLVNVRQRHFHFHRISQQREMEIQEAFREYNGDYEEEEGEFVHGMMT